MLDPDAPADSPDARIARSLGTPAAAFDRLERYRLHAERTYHRAHRELTRLQRQARRDHQDAVSQRIDQLLNAPLPNEANYDEYRAVLRNEANPSLPLTSEFRPVEPPVSNSPKCYDAEDVRSGSRCA